ncbi:MAG TPA: hypothetical protein VGK57_07990 [Candidatus Binatia bacterium]|jgi:hypothetical protein
MLQFGHIDSQDKPAPFKDVDQILVIVVAAADPFDQIVPKPKRRNDDWDSRESLCYSDNGAKREQNNRDAVRRESAHSLKSHGAPAIR